jgi:hypothetical protein
VEAGNELVLPAADRDLSLGRSDDDRDQHALQADALGERVDMVDVQRPDVLSDVDLVERHGALACYCCGDHQALL